MIPTFTVTFISSVLSLVISIKVRSGNIPENMRNIVVYSFLLSFCNWYLSLFN